MKLTGFESNKINSEMVNHPSRYNLPNRKECIDEMIDIYGLKDSYEFGMDLAFGVLSVYEGKPERVLEIQKYVNEQYECCSNKKFMKVLETIARMNGNEEVYIEDMYACNKEARNYYLSELMMCFNFVFNEMCHGTGSAAGCDFNNEEE